MTTRSFACALAALGCATAGGLLQLELTLDSARRAQPANRLLAACHLDEGYVHAARSLSALLLVGSAFDDAGSTWNAFAPARGGLDDSVQFAGLSTFALSTSAGGGGGVSNRGLGNEGLFVRAGEPYEGFVLARADAAAVSLVVSLRRWADAAGAPLPVPVTLATSTLDVPAAPGGWARLNFSMTVPAASGDLGCAGVAPGSVAGVDCGSVWPSPAHVCVVCGGELFVGFADGSGAASAHLAYVLLQPGPARRFAGLPVLLEGVENLQAMGVTGLRVGGTYAQGVFWRQWRGAPWVRDARRLYAGTGNLIGDFGMFEMLDLGVAMGAEIIITMSRNHTEADVADLVEYAYGDASTEYGALRTFNDSHPAPYALTGIELGNEQPCMNWTSLIKAMEARWADLERAGRLAAPQPSATAASPFYYLWPENAMHGDDVAELQAAGFPAEKIMADSHGSWGGQLDGIETDFAHAPAGYNISGINCETNGGSSLFLRAMQEAADLIAFDNAAPDVYARVRARMMSFCSERSGHFTRYDQGGSFFLPNATWLAPPGQVHAMNKLLRAGALDSDLLVLPASPPSPPLFPPAAVGALRAGGPPPPLAPLVFYSAMSTRDGASVFLRLANANTSDAASVTLSLPGFSGAAVAALLLDAGGDVNATNSPSEPLRVSPRALAVSADGERVSLTVPPFSYVVLNATKAAARGTTNDQGVPT